MLKNTLFAAAWLLIALAGLLFLQKNPRFQAASLADLNTAQAVDVYRLDLSDEQLQDIPDVALQLAHLEQFSYDGGEYTGAIFDSLWGAEKAHLDEKLRRLSQHKLCFLSEKIAVWADLQTLNLPNHRIKQLPVGFCGFAQLKNLNLSGNLLAFLPDSLGYLQNLQILNLSHNQITALPHTFFALAQLKELNLSHNRLIATGEIFCFMPHLASLDLAHNQLQRLPASVRKLTRLQWLDLSGNNLSAAHQTEIRGWLPRTKIVF